MFFHSRLRCFAFPAVFCLLLFLFPGCGPSKSKKVSYFRRRQGVFHTVRRGQTLWRIAKRYGVRVEDIVRANGIADPDKIKAGQRLFIPKATKARKAKPYSTRKVKKAVKGKFIWPLKGKLVAGYGYQAGMKNDGIDIAAPVGTDVRAAHSGRVIYADNKMQYYGNMIIVKHQAQYFTVYAHNSVNLVSVNQWVTQGQVIAKVGGSGRASSPRLHFEIRHGEKPVNPLAYLP
jgi:lipoprotein NlpD